jgi:hypothetical protein
VSVQHLDAAGVTLTARRVCSFLMRGVLVCLLHLSDVVCSGELSLEAMSTALGCYIAAACSRIPH